MSKVEGHAIEKYPAGYERWVALKTGKFVFIRPIKTTDAPRLKDLFSRLSQETIHARFLGLMRALPDDLLYQFTHLDYISHFALAAAIREEPGESVIAVGRYAWNDEIQMPELAFAIRDDWQGKGLGTVLFHHIAEAAIKNGFIRFHCLVKPDNNAMRGIIEKSGFPYSVRYTGGFCYYESDISGIFL